MEHKPTALSLTKGQVATIDSVTSNEFRSRLLSLGIIPGKKCKILGSAPFGGAKILALENHLIALRKEELLSIIVRLEKPSGL